MAPDRVYLSLEKSLLWAWISNKKVIKRKGRYKDMTKEHFENNTNWKMTYEEFQKCDCTHCDKKDCVHRNAFRRVPRIDGGLGLCPNLKQ